MPSPTRDRPSRIEPGAGVRLLQPRCKVSRDRYHGDVDAGTAEASRACGEDAITRANRHVPESVIDAFVVQDVQKSEIGPIRA